MATSSTEPLGAEVGGIVRAYPDDESKPGEKAKDVTTAKAVGSAVVYVVELPPTMKFDTPKAPVVLHFRGGAIVPRCSYVQVAQPLVVVADDERNHRLAVIARQRPLVAPLAPPENPRRFLETFSTPEDGILLQCDLHPDERAHVSVVPNPVVTMTTANGTFRLPHRLPPGSYLLRAYHPDWGRAEKEVTLDGSKGELRVEIDFRP